MELIFTLVLAATAVAGSSGIELERLTDNSITPPGIDGEFFIEVLPPTPCGAVVLFNGSGTDALLGAYAASPGSVEVIANAGTPVPGSDGTFQEAWQQDCAGGRVVFLGDDDITPSSSGRSVYSWVDGVVVPIIEEGIHIGASEVQSFNKLTGNELGVAMVAALVPASIRQALVIKPYGHEPLIVADRTTVLPGQTDPVTIFSQPVLVGFDLIFHARTGENLGIYRWSEGQGITVVVDIQTPVPFPLGGSFGIFGQIANLDYGIVFDAWYTGGRGIFVSSDGQLHPLIAPGDLTQDGETIVAAYHPSGGGSLLSFTASTGDGLNEALFVRTRDGRIRRILGSGDIIEDRTVGFFNAGADRSTVAIRVTSLGEPRNEVIYRASFAETVDIPALSTLGVAALVVGLMLAGLWILRRSALFSLASFE